MSANTALQPSWVYAFGGFRLDPNRGILTYGSEVVPLPERLFALLLALITANGKVVSRETLSRAIAPDDDISDANLSQHIYLLRKVLGERARDRLYLMTVHARGFRFTAPVTVLSPSDEENDAFAGTGRPSELPSCEITAFRHYVRGSYLLEGQSAFALRAAIKAFDNALAVSPAYEPALVGLGHAYAMLAERSYIPGSYAFTKAKQVVLRALQANPKSAAGHAEISNLFLFSDWDWREAKREIDKAVRLNPDSVFVCTNAAWFYNCTGAAERALSLAQHALEMQAASATLQFLFGRTLLVCGELEQALQYFTELVETGVVLPTSQRHHAIALMLTNRPHEAVVELLGMHTDGDRSEEAAMRLPLLGRAYADSGDMERAYEIYEMLLEMSKTEYVTHWSLALVATGLERYDKALEHLELSAQCREPSFLMRRDYWFAPISKTEKYKNLARSSGLTS